MAVSKRRSGRKSTEQRTYQLTAKLIAIVQLVAIICIVIAAIIRIRKSIKLARIAKGALYLTDIGHHLKQI